MGTGQIETYTAKQVKDGIPMPGQKPVRVFSRETLPPGLHKVYRHAARFVAMLRSKTSQVSIPAVRVSCSFWTDMLVLLRIAVFCERFRIDVYRHVE